MPLEMGISSISANNLDLTFRYIVSNAGDSDLNGVSFDNTALIVDNINTVKASVHSNNANPFVNNNVYQIYQE